MGNICIHTTLMNCPKPRKHEIITITRGATASFDFPLFDKVYGIDNIVQMTFAFKQGKTITWFNMINYFVVSTDTTVDTSKTYYTLSFPNIDYSLMCEATAVAEPTGSPKDNGYYELVNNIDDDKEAPWCFDKHFYYNNDENYSFVNFTLRSAETKNFNLTTPGNNMQFEVTIILDTNSLAGMNNYDSVIIEPQHPVAVVDSIYNYIGTTSGSGETVKKAIPSTTTLCSTSLLCNKYV